jgi:hypothetical protein
MSVARAVRNDPPPSGMRARPRAPTPPASYTKLAMPTLYLCRYHRYLDRLRNRWLTASYVAQREEIEQRYAVYEIIGEPEVRYVPRRSQTCSSWHFALPAREEEAIWTYNAA